jgi:hypothetical protein
MKIFLSHSAKDTELAEMLIALLRASLPLASKDIRCSSVDGYRLPLGADTDETLRQEVFDADLLIGLLTPVSLASTYVLFELGARWGAGRGIAPLLACGAAPALLPGPLARANSLDISRVGQVQQLVEDIGDVLNLLPDRPASYQSSIDRVVALASVISPTARISVGPRNRNAAFLAGMALGDPLAVLPFKSDDEQEGDESLAEAVDALDKCGLSGSDVDNLRSVSNNPFEKPLNEDLFSDYISSVHNVRDQARRELDSPLYEWYVIGELLGQIQAISLVPRLYPGSEADLEAQIIAFESIITAVDAPATLIEQMRRFAQELKDTDEQKLKDADDMTAFFARAQSLGKLIYTVLDSISS